jgi:HD-like signal output (HDOD) protein
MPEVAHRLLKSFDREDLGMQELADLIGRDQGLSAKLLRLANSARYSPRHTIASLQDAATSIGLNSLRDLALAACVAGAFPTTQAFDRMRFWRKCLATAGHARVLAQGSDLDPDSAYLAGLLMRTGELLMLMQDPEAIAEAEEAAHLPDSLLDHEMRLLQCTHLDVSAELARRWKFPDELVRALSAAADPMASKPFCPLGGVLRLASVLADAGDMGLDPMATLQEFQPELVHHMHFDLNADWLASHLASYESLTSGVDQLLH